MAINRYRPINRPSRTSTRFVSRLNNYGINQQAVSVVDYAEVLDKIYLRCIRYDKDSREINCIHPDESEFGHEEFVIQGISGEHLGIALSMPVQLSQHDLGIIIQNFGPDLFRLISKESRLADQKLYIVYNEAEDSAEKFDEFLLIVEQFIAKVIVYLKLNQKFSGINARFFKSSVQDLFAQYLPINDNEEIPDELAALLATKN